MENIICKQRHNKFESVSEVCWNKNILTGIDKGDLHYNFINSIGDLKLKVLL